MKHVCSTENRPLCSTNVLKTNFIATFVTAFVYYSKNSLYGRIIMIKSIQSLSIFEKFKRSDFGI